MKESVSLYRLGNFGELRALFEKYFHTAISPFYDGGMTYMCNKIKINIFKFDDWLHEEHGDYENNGESMAEIIERIYGRDARIFIEGFV